MKSLIISGVVSASKKLAKRFKSSKLGALIDDLHAGFGRSWNKSIITGFLKSDNGRTKNSVLKRITMSPFTFLEFVSGKIGDKLSASIEKSVLCETARRYVHNFMALNTRFFGIMMLCASIAYNALKFTGTGYINKYIAVISAVSALLVIPNMNITGFLGTSKLVDFVKACAGVKNITFDFWDNNRTKGALRLVAGALVGVVTGIALYVSPIIGILVPFAVFGMLLVLGYPITGVYAAVFVAPLIPFSSLPLAGICIWTLLSLVIKSLSDKNFKWKREGVGVALVLFLAVLFVTSLFSFARTKSLVVWAMYFVFITFYFAIINTIKTKEQLYGLLRIFVISGAFVALYGVLQYIFGWTTTNAWIDEEMFEEETMRVYSTLANPNVLGEYLLLVLPVSVVMFLKDKAKSLSKWVYLAVTGILFLCLILTQSRGCWLGFMISTVIFVTFYEGRWWAFVPLALCALPFVLPQTIIERFMSIGDMGDSSTSYRVFIWMGAMGIVRNYFMGGIGMGEGAFAEVYPLFSYNAIIAPHAHNTYLQLLVEGGIPALSVFIAVIVVFFKNTHNGYRLCKKKSYDSAVILGLVSGIAGFLFQSLFDYTFYNYRVMAVFFMVIAITISLSGLVKEGADEKTDN